MLHLPFWKDQKPLKRTNTDLEPSKITEVEKASCRMLNIVCHHLRKHAHITAFLWVDDIYGKIIFKGLKSDNKLI